MSDINKVILCGRLTRDVELSYTQGNNTAIAKFSIALNEKRGDNEKVHYVDIVVWGKMAEVCNQYIGKGRQVIIDGKLSHDRWQDNQGQNRSKISVIAQNVQFVGGRGGDNSGQQQDNFSNMDNYADGPDMGDIPF